MASFKTRNKAIPGTS